MILVKSTQPPMGFEWPDFSHLKGGKAAYKQMAVKELKKIPWPMVIDPSQNHHVTNLVMQKLPSTIGNPYITDGRSLVLSLVNTVHQRAMAHAAKIAVPALQTPGTIVFA